MLIYGTKRVLLKSEKSTKAECPDCKTKGSLLFHVFSAHAHVFWIPTFPIGKKGISECQLCSGVWESKDMPEKVKFEYKKVKSESRVPIWQFTGIALFATLISWGVIANNENKEKELIHLANPQKGDIYKFKTESNYYSTLKIAKVTTDSIYIFENTYETDKMSGVYKIDKDENYSNNLYGVSKVTIKEMYEDGAIYSIDR